MKVLVTITTLGLFYFLTFYVNLFVSLVLPMVMVYAFFLMLLCEFRLTKKALTITFRWAPFKNFSVNFNEITSIKLCNNTPNYAGSEWIEISFLKSGKIKKKTIYFWAISETDLKDIVLLLKDKKISISE